MSPSGPSDTWSLRCCAQGSQGHYLLANTSGEPALRVAITSSAERVVVLDEHCGQDIGTGSSRVFAAMVSAADQQVRVCWTGSDGRRQDWRTALPVT